MASESLVLSNTNHGYLYNRTIHEPAIKLINKLNSLYNAKTVLTTSGMNAISQVIQVIMNNCSNQINIVHSNEIYSDTPTLFKYWSQFYNCNRYEFDPLQTGKLIELFKSFTGPGPNQGQAQTTNILFVETCSNPKGYVFDFSCIETLRKISKNLYVIIDNTWITSASFNPFIYDVDVVINSLTKYYSAGTCIMGAIMTKNIKLHQKLVEFSRVNGLHISPLHCEHVLNNIDSLNDRLSKSSDITNKIVDLLVNHKNVVDVYHCSVKNHPSYNLAKKYFKLSPSVISFVIETDRASAITFMKSTGLDYKTSFGHQDSRFDTYPRDIEGGTLCRLSIGYNDNFEQLSKILSNALDNNIKHYKLSTSIPVHPYSRIKKE
jgi:cystathionine beta-lyase/cystathionine gamma-synthase